MTGTVDFVMLIVAFFFMLSTGFAIGIMGGFLLGTHLEEWEKRKEEENDGSDV